MKSDINTKLNQMSATELKEIIDNSYLYDTEIVEKAKELFAAKDIQAAPVVENIQEIAPSRKKGNTIMGISAIVIVIALFAVMFGIRANTVKGNIELRDYNGKVLLTKEDIKKAVAITENDSSYVELTFTASGKEKFASATEQISALGDGQNSIQIYLNDELISVPVITQRVESDTVNIAPLTSEDATNIANAINDGNYTDGYISYVSNEPNTAPAKELRILTNATLEPFEYYSGNDVVGFDIDLIKALCSKLGYEAIIEDVVFDAITTEITTGKADGGIAAICITEERKRSVDFSDIYISCYVDYGDGQGKVEQDFAIAFPKGSSLIGEFNSAIELAKTDGTIDALVEKWNIDIINN